MENNSKALGDIQYDRSMHTLGRTSMAVILCILISIPFFICLIFQEQPNFSPAFWAAFLPIVLVYLPSCLIEVITYSPLLGTGGTYLAFITGNLINLKIPCVMNSREMMGTQVGTKENEIVSTISVATSAIVTTLVIILGVILIIPLTPLLENPVLLPAFKTVVPAVFGALGFQYAKEHPQIAVAPLAVSIGLFLAFPQLTNSVSMLVVAIAIVSIGFTYLLYRKGKV